jgi:glycine cleavage system H protein
MAIDMQARYLKSHEWARQEDDEIVVGISDHAQEQLGDIVYVELPEVGDEVARGEAFGSVESVKAASDIYAPVSGVVSAINEELEDAPELVNQDPYGKGWMIKIEPSDLEEWDELLTPEAYEQIVEEEA